MGLKRRPAPNSCLYIFINPALNRIDRLSAILIQLQSRKVVRASEIADRFEISLRTVYRDIRALEEAGVPIGAEAGLGYYLMEGYNLPPVKFSKDEAGAILMASKLAYEQTDSSVKKNLNDALYKIRAALRLEEKDYLESIEHSIEVLPSVINPNNESQFPDHFLTDLKSALAGKRVVQFEYYSNYNDSYSTREVEPLSLCYYARHWHLIAYCRSRKALRDFRSDRIIKLKITDSVFDKSRHKDYKGYLKSVIQESQLTEVKVDFDKEAAKIVKEYRYLMGYVDSKVNNGLERMRFMTSDLDSFSRWIIQFSDSTKVISPSQLKDKVIDLYQRGLKFNQ